QPLTVFGDGSQTRSFTYVTDLVDGILRTAYSPSAEGEVINLGNNIETTIIDLAKNIKNVTKSESEIIFLPLPEDDPKRRCPDVSKANNILDWKPVTGLQSGLKKTISWFIGKN
ncbi:MAG: GDP-mannose 4,6-dehydratase, partial [Flavobacteriaceae bacterium]